MGRPNVPLIEKNEAIAKALEIIDRDGVDALSIRRLGTELGVNGASLYHHFADKDEILDGVRRLVLERLTVPETNDIAWQDFVLESAIRFRDALLHHPNSAPLMLPGSARPLGLSIRDFLAQAIMQAGVPAHYVYPIMDSTETLAFGAAMMNPHQRTPNDRLGRPSAAHPNLRTVLDAATTSPDEMFRLQVEVLIEGWTDRIEREQGASRAPRKRAKAG